MERGMRQSVRDTISGSTVHIHGLTVQCFDELEPGVVEIRLLGDKEFLKTSQVGNDLIFRHHARTHPAFYVTYSKDIVLQDIVLYHCGRDGSDCTCFGKPYDAQI